MNKIEKLKGWEVNKTDYPPEARAVAIALNQLNDKINEIIDEINKKHV